MTAPASPEATPTDPAEPAVPAAAPESSPQGTPTPEPVDPPAPEVGENTDGLPEWARKKLDKANREAKNLRDRLKDQEPMVAAAQEAERAKMSELERANADLTTLREQLATRDTDLLKERYQIPDDYLEFIGEGTYEEKEARAAKVGLMVQSAKNEEPGKPPSQRPVESLRPGASPTPPPAVDTAYPAAWRPASREN